MKIICPHVLYKGDLFQTLNLSYVWQLKWQLFAGKQVSSDEKVWLCEGKCTVLFNEIYHVTCQKLWLCEGKQDFSFPQWNLMLGGHLFNEYHYWEEPNFHQF